MSQVAGNAPLPPLFTPSGLLARVGDLRLAQAAMNRSNDRLDRDPNADGQGAAAGGGWGVKHPIKFATHGG